MVDELEKVGNEILLETLKTADRRTDKYNEARKEIDSRIIKSKGDNALIGAKTAAIMENMGVSTTKEYEDQLILESQNPHELIDFEERKAFSTNYGKNREAEADLLKELRAMAQSLDGYNPDESNLHEHQSSSLNKAAQPAQRTEEMDRSPSVDVGADAPNLRARQSSSSNKATAQPAKGAEEMPKELTDILTPLDKLAKNKDLGLYIGADNARKFKEKMEEINVGLGEGGLPQENKQAFLKSRLGELDKFCDKQMEKIPTSGFKQFAKVIKHAVVAAISSIKGGLGHEKNMQKFNQSWKEFSDSAEKFKENLKSIKTTIKQPGNIDTQPTKRQANRSESMSRS